MLQEISLSEAQSKFPELLQAVINGEEILIFKDQKPIARLSPYWERYS